MRSATQKLKGPGATMVGAIKSCMVTDLVTVESHKLTVLVDFKVITPAPETGHFISTVSLTDGPTMLPPVTDQLLVMFACGVVQYFSCANGQTVPDPLMEVI